jgi:hypothetical protein
MKTIKVVVVGGEKHQYISRMGIKRTITIIVMVLTLFDKKK